MCRRIESCPLGAFLLAALSLAVGGCSHKAGFPEATVAGNVTVGGAAAPRGTITFSPLAAGQGPVAGAAIEQGRYRCERVPVGKLNVTFTIQASEPRRFTDATGVVREVPQNLLPDQYRQGLPAGIKEGENRLDFSLEAPAPEATPKR